MMTDNDYQNFVCVVAGDNPDELMKPFDKNKKVKPYIVYRYKDAGKIKAKYLEFYQEALKNYVSTSGDPEIEQMEKSDIQDTIQDLAEMSDNEFFADLTADKFIIDEETGDALSDTNKDGRWRYYNIGRNFSIPFLLKDGREVYQAKKSEIDWNKIHLNGGEIYGRAWDMVMEGSEPNNDYEQQIYDNMKDKESYFKKFETRDNYITSNTAFWGFAFLSDKTGWQEATELDDQFVWMSNYYDVFIKNLPEDTTLTIFECRK